MTTQEVINTLEKLLMELKSGSTQELKSIPPPGWHPGWHPGWYPGWGGQMPGGWGGQMPGYMQNPTILQALSMGVPIGQAVAMMLAGTLQSYLMQMMNPVQPVPVPVPVVPH